MNYSNKKIIIWGYGFIGRHLAELLRKDNLVYVIKRHEKNDTPINLHNIIEVDENDISKIGQADIMYFLAWNGTSGEMRGNIEIQLKNVELTCHAIQCAADLHCQKFVYAGSIMEYEAIAYINQNGSTPRYNYIYSVSKLTADYFSKILANELQIEYCNALISNIYGPGEVSQRFIISMCKKMINSAPIELTEGSQLYDFIYISDAISALKLIGFSGTGNYTYYIGNKEQHPLKEYILKMKSALNSNSELYFGAFPFTGTSLTYKEFDTASLERLGFKCQITFEDGIKKTAAWLKQEGLL